MFVIMEPAAKVFEHIVDVVYPFFPVYFSSKILTLIILLFF